MLDNRDAMAIRGRPCGHPWTALCGHPWTALCGHPWTALCGHPWTALCGHPWTTPVWPSVDDPVWPSVDDPVWPSVDDPVWPSVDDPVWPSVDGPVWPSVDGPVWPKKVHVPQLSEVRPLDLLAFNGNSSLDHWELPLLHNRDAHNLDGELQQWNFHRFLYGQDRGHLSLYNDGHFTNFVQDLQM